MYRRMLVLLDGSELAEVVFPFVIDLAARLEMEVILLQVYGAVGREYVPVHRAYVERSAEMIGRRVEELRRKLGPAAEGGGSVIRGELANGHYADEILRYADENEVDLMMMASHGRSGIRRWRMGSVAEKVLRASKIPVWFVHAGVEDAVPYDQWPAKTFLVPLDGSERAEAVLPHVETLARQRTAEPVNVILLRGCDPPVAPSYYSPEMSGVPLNWGEFMEQETARCRQAAHEYLAGVTERLESTGAQVTSLILVGKPADEIIQTAAENPLSVIVMTTHGRSGISRLVYGSVAESVLTAASNPILLIRPTHKQS